ncbi:hypothetical protein QQG74_21580 [Micromonospora sp. FIMYZ51]|uniref:hypothetical protein n=1 Tax=Micromonospora sp. FIMYZ51 TaxID=3051832 RepID=UPI00311FA6B4
MSLYTLTPKAGYERYTIQVGWNPHRTYFATLVDHATDPPADPDNQPKTLQLGLIETILDPAEVLRAVEPYAVIPDDLATTLHTDQATHPTRRARSLGLADIPTPRQAGRAAPTTTLHPPATQHENHTVRRSPSTSGHRCTAVAITGSRLLRAELHAVEQDAGCEFDYADSVPDGRRYATRRPLIIIGADLLTRIRRPLTCRGLVIVATVNPPTDRLWEPAQRAGATYVIVLPTARGWLAHHLLRDLPT